MGPDERGSQRRSQARRHGEHRRVPDGVPEGADVVRGDVVAAVVHGLVRPDDADVAVGPRPEVVEDAGTDRPLDEADRVSLVHALPPGGLEDGHGGQRSGPHGGVAQLGRAAVVVDLVDGGAVDVAPAQH